MLPLPRIAVGTVQSGVSHRAILWAMIDALRRQGLQIQTFSSRACFAQHRAATAMTGASPRHLDSWLMTPEQCRELFIAGAEACDLAVVEGPFDVALQSSGAPLTDGESAPSSPLPKAKEKRGGSLDVLCEWLDLPRLAVLDASLLDGGLSDPPGRIDGVLLDRVDSGSRQARLTIEIETQWEVPVLGSLGPVPELRERLRDLGVTGRPNDELADQLGDHFLRSGETERIVEIAQRRCRLPTASVELPVQGQPASFVQSCGSPPTASSAAPPMADLTVALAYDEALNCYFPDTLDWLELSGATVIDFSPLHDDRLPEADVVYLGCGHPETMARVLSDNDCMRLALREHVRRGGRVYAEGGGMAYLCHQLEAEDGSLHRMVGVLPAIARLNPQPSEPLAVSATLAEGCWLGPPGEQVRGYLSDRWVLEPTGLFTPGLAEPEYHRDVIQCCHVIGSRIHLDFAAQLHLLVGFFQPHTARGDTNDPWQV